MAATGDTVESYGSAVQIIGAQSHPVSVFHDDQLTIGMHALSDLTNAPYYNTVTFDKDGFAVHSPTGALVCANSKDPDARMWYLPTSQLSPTSRLCFH